MKSFVEFNRFIFCNFKIISSMLESVSLETTSILYFVFVPKNGIHLRIQQMLFTVTWYLNEKIMMIASCQVVSWESGYFKSNFWWVYMQYYVVWLKWQSHTQNRWKNWMAWCKIEGPTLETKFWCKIENKLSATILYT